MGTTRISDLFRRESPPPLPGTVRSERLDGYHNSKLHSVAKQTFLFQGISTRLQIQMNQTDAGLFEAFVIAYYFQFVKHESNLYRVFKDHYDLQLSQCHSKGLK